ncbi:MAG: hypothetical protein GY807_19400 [Gammaproteobacteria bacterium]|nr:hypothetical protein [Gammaproteobacteria bacterium]
MNKKLNVVKLGLALVLLGLVFGVGMGISFGINEDMYKDFIAEGVAANPEVHDAKSKAKIWRYAQRAHFHATGIAAFSLGLVILVMFSEMKARVKAISSVLIGLGSFYPLAWFTMFLLAPSIGRDSAHHYILTEIFTYIGVGGLLTGAILLFSSLFLGMFAEDGDG